MFGSIGFPELILIFMVVLLVFGPNKLPEFAKMFGKVVRDFRSTVEEAKSTIQEEIDKTEVVGDIRTMKQELQGAVDQVNAEASVPPAFDTRQTPQETGEDDEKKGQ